MSNQRLAAGILRTGVNRINAFLRAMSTRMCLQLNRRVPSGNHQGMFVQTRSQAGIRRLRGRIRWEGDLEASRDTRAVKGE
jgi:hypothetical protein